MTSVVVLDTSYLDELMSIPGKSDPIATAMIKEKFRQNFEAGSRFFVPFPVVLELANHISNVPDGNVRGKLSDDFSRTITLCVEDNGPWVVTLLNDNPVLEINDLMRLCNTFCDEFSMQQISITDTAVISEARRLKVQYRSYRFPVYIWTRDHGMKAHEPDTEIDAYI